MAVTTATIATVRPPRWFWIVAALITLWGAIGCLAAWMQIGMGPAEIAALPEADRLIWANLPGWFHALYAGAVITSLVGGVALLLRSGHARTLLLLSLVLVVAQFGYVFLATQTVALKGAAATVPFPLFIIAVAVAELWFAGVALRRGWIG